MIEGEAAVRALQPSVAKCARAPSHDGSVANQNGGVLRFSPYLPSRDGSVAADLHFHSEGGIGREMMEGEAAVRAVQSADLRHVVTPI